MKDNNIAENQPTETPVCEPLPPSRPSFPSWYNFLVLALLFAISQAVIGFVALKCGCTPEVVQQIAAPEAGPHSLPDTTMNTVARATAIGYVAGMAVMVVLTLLYRRLRGGRGRVAGFSPRGFDPALLLEGFVVVLAANVVLEPLAELLPGDPDYNMLGRGGWALLSTVICAPLFEEFLFRGVILEAVRRRRGAVAAWLISSLCFGLAHGLPSQMVVTAVVGLILGYVCIRSGSLFSSILLHGLNNALAMLLLLIGMGDASFSELLGGGKVYWAVYAVAAVVFICWAVGACRTIRRINRRDA